MNERNLSSDSDGEGAYKVVDLHAQNLLLQQVDVCKGYGFKCIEDKTNLPIIYGLPKMHKTFINSDTLQPVELPP